MYTIIVNILCINRESDFISPYLLRNGCNVSYEMGVKSILHMYPTQSTTSFNFMPLHIHVIGHYFLFNKPVTISFWANDLYLSHVTRTSKFGYPKFL